MSFCSDLSGRGLLNKIRILPEILSNQIAAGEVVQRPASVVKELVENSMDAGADQIVVDIENGGRRLIRVSDNGIGLSSDDALLAIERYATSKIFSKEDLFSISTFGFRGEALPSIASVSKFTLVSRPKNEPGATCVEISGGKLVKVSETGAPKGTMVEVRQLFFNTPARRKFLKSETTENSHISDAVFGLAMGNPGIGFKLTMNNRLVRHFPKNQDAAGRARMLLGRDASPHLYPLEFEANDIRVSGVCANPAVTRSTASRIYLFVNKRLVRDAGLVASMFKGCRGRIMKGRYPVGVVCIDLPYDQVDVNVHPTKREIKFISPQPVYHALAEAVARAMTQAQAMPHVYARSGPVLPKAGTPGMFGNGGATRIPRHEPQAPTDTGRGTAAGNEPPLPLEHRPAPEHSGYSPRQDRGDVVAQSRAVWQGSTKETVPEKNMDTAPQENSPVPKRAGTAKQPEPPGLATEASFMLAHHEKPRVVGQVLGTYIVVEKDSHLVLVDQHAAHERITYEALKKRHGSLGIQSQDLMVPEVLELTHLEADLLSSILDDLNRLGVRIEPFGGTSFVIKSIPVLLDGRAIQPFIMDVIETLNQDKGMGEKDVWLDDCLVTMACHRSIRANQPMGLAEMERLMADLWRCDNPMHCPHGRPILISFDRGQLEKLFKRVV